MIHVIAKITTLPGKRADVLKEFSANIPAVVAEKGCKEYQPVVDVTNAGDFQSAIGADTFLVVEKWQTIEDLHAHAKSKHMASYANKVKDMIADRTIHILTDA